MEYDPSTPLRLTHYVRSLRVAQDEPVANHRHPERLTSFLREESKGVHSWTRGVKDYQRKGIDEKFLGLHP
jgi:hypothetical protein